MSVEIKEYNPLAASYTAKRHELALAELEITRCHDEYAWVKQFDVEAAASAYAATNLKSRTLSRELLELGEVIANLDLKASVLAKDASLGLNPRYFFSAERREKKAELVLIRAKLVQLQESLVEKQDRVANYDIESSSQKTDLNRHHSFDKLSVEATLRAVSIQIEQLTSEVDELGPLKERVDGLLKPLLDKLMELLQQKEALETELDRAKQMERNLACASNGYERKQVHSDCRNLFNESSPEKVISSRLNKLQSIERNAKKLDQRLKMVAKRATGEIKKLVIDGNNLCYRQDIFIGLDAILAVASKLSSDYSVLVVFDATIRNHLRASDSDISSYFGRSCEVHVVASGQKADETVLDAASESNTYVISNDSFGDFPEKSAVQNRRLIKHEILSDRVFIHDLDLDESFTKHGRR